MRIDLTTCRDPELLAAEVRRLRTALAALADQDATLTDDERQAMEFFAAMQWPSQSRQIKARAATLRELLERIT